MREILYKPSKEKESEKKEESIVEWIKSHPRFKWSTMCPEIGVDKGNFSKMLKSGYIKLPEDKIAKIKQIIKNYGYGK
jgi:hypothetical protein